MTGEAVLPDMQDRFHVYFMCNSCFMPVVALIESSAGTAPSQARGDILKAQAMYGMSVKRIIPASVPLAAPEYCPDSVASAFIQAEAAIKGRHWESAAAMDRRALEIATKEMAPEHVKLNLYQRIEKLAEAKKLTDSLKKWAHGLRTIGNDAVHEADGVEEKETIQAHELTRFILIYLYTLPAQVEHARAARKNGK